MTEQTTAVQDEFIEGKILLFDKPYKWTSFDAVNKIKWHLKRSYGLKKIKVGHAGTLDPLATGLLIICIGKQTKQIENIQSMPKEYYAKISLGQTTPSFDMETEISQTWTTSHITKEMVEQVLKQLTGTIMQEPPLFSAKRVNGKRAYDLARQGQDKKLESVEVTIYKNELVNFRENEIEIQIKCSKGTYIRSIARDIGLMLNNGACLKELRRTAIGNYHINNAESPDFFCQKIAENNIH